MLQQFRKALREAIAAREVVRSDLVNCRSALARAENVVANAQRNLDEFKNLDEQLLDAQAQGLRGGGTRLAPVPPDLQDRLALRTRAENDLQVATTVSKKLRDECAALEKSLAEAVQWVEQQAGTVLAEEARILAEEFNVKLDEVRKLHRRIIYASRQTFPHPIIPLGPDGRTIWSQAQRFPKMAAVVVQAVNEDVQGKSQLYLTATAKERELAAVREHWRALMDDADAMLDDAP